MISIGDVTDDLNSFRPVHIAPCNHLCLRFRDKHTPDKPNAPDVPSIRPLFDWLNNAVDISELLIHCGAGMSRSPAIAVLAMCYIYPHADANDQMLLVESACDYEHIWPNPLVVHLGDEMMQRNGEISSAVDRWRNAQR